MATPPISSEVARATLAAVEQCLKEGFGPPHTKSPKGSATEEAAKRLIAAGMLKSRSSMTSRIRTIAAMGMEPDWSLYSPEKPRFRVKVASTRPPADTPPAISPEQIRAEVMRILRRRSLTVDEVASAIGVDGSVADEIMHSLRDAGVSLHQFAGRWQVTAPQASHVAGPRFEFVSRPDNTFSFGVTSDNHIGSKYARVDVLDDLYDRFERAGVQAVLNAGNWIDGEASFNKHDLVVHGMDAQLQLLARQYPRRAGIKTYAVTGDDHEGWYAQREGVDIGRYAQRVMEDAGRDDWVDVGYMEAHFILRNANTGASAVMALVHPGGGSAYAISYSIQKIIECVPLNSEILTQSGWRRWDEIAIGDMVLGYSLERDRCEWTPVRAIHRGRAEVMRYGNGNFSVECTRNHRWPMEWESRAGPNPQSRVPSSYTRKERRLWTLEESKARSRIIQAARAVDGPGLPLLTHDDWLRRENTVATVLKMTSGERRAFIEGMLVGEGTVGNVRGHRTVMFAQRSGPVNDGFRLACFLEGIATTEKSGPPGSFKPEGRPTMRVTLLKKNLRHVDLWSGRGWHGESLGEQEVWCPTTDLGTWAMRQGDLITLTGNSLDGGEKPAVGVYGHYHKLWAGNIRNVWCLQSGCTQDATPFMRKKKLAAHVGGAIMDLEQDPETGAIIGFTPKMLRYFVRGYYENRWSHHGGVTLPERAA